MTRVQVCRSGVRNPEGAGDFFSFPNRADRLCGSPSFLFSGYRGSFRGVKWPVWEVEHSPPSGDEVRNEWSYITSTPLHAFMAQTGTALPLTVPRNNWKPNSSVGVLISVSVDFRQRKILICSSKRPVRLCIPPSHLRNYGMDSDRPSPSGKADGV